MVSANLTAFIPILGLLVVIHLFHERSLFVLKHL